MIKHTHLFLRAQLGAPGFVKRAVLFGSGAIAGAVVSATTSYVVVSALFPRQSTAAMTATASVQSSPAARPVSPDLPRNFTLASAPSDGEIIVTPLTPLAAAPVATTNVAAAATTPEQPVAASAVPAPQDETASHFIFASKSVPEIALAPVDVETAPAPAPTLTVATAQTEAAVGPTGITPAGLAALSAQEATSRASATLDFAAATRPEARPEVHPENQAEPVVSAALAAAPVAAPDMPGTRPAPRPDTAPILLALAQEAPFAETIPGLRPQPRPDNFHAEIIRVAATQPATSIAAGTGASERAPRSTGTGLFGGGSGACRGSLARSMPRRSGSAAGGEAFFAALGGLSGSERDARVVKELARGNMPAFLRQLKPVTFRGKDSRGADTEIVICVTPDYLALGSDRDYVRVPLGLPAAARIAGRFNMLLPTPRMVDAIYAQADVKLSPAPMQAGPQMSSTAYLLRHDATIDNQLRGRHGLIAGQKKDVVMASRMASAPGRVAIYGWHRSGGRPIQPVSTVHGANYADYSHGIRLVSKTAYLNGKPVALDELLGSSRYAYLLNKEGPLPGPVIRTASR